MTVSVISEIVSLKDRIEPLIQEELVQLYRLGCSGQADVGASHSLSLAQFQLEAVLNLCKRRLVGRFEQVKALGNLGSVPLTVTPWASPL